MCTCGNATGKGVWVRRIISRSTTDALFSSKRKRLANVPDRRSEQNSTASVPRAAVLLSLSIPSILPKRLSYRYLSHSRRIIYSPKWTTSTVSHGGNTMLERAFVFFIGFLGALMLLSALICLVRGIYAAF